VVGTNRTRRFIGNSRWGRLSFDRCTDCHLSVTLGGLLDGLNRKINLSRSRTDGHSHGRSGEHIGDWRLDGGYGGHARWPRYFGRGRSDDGRLSHHVGAGRSSGGRSRVDRVRWSFRRRGLTTRIALAVKSHEYSVRGMELP